MTAEHPRHNALRLAWERAVTATDLLSEKHDAMLTKAHASFDAPAIYRQLLNALTRNLEASCQRENEAGRAYLTALQHHEPREDTPRTDQEEAWARALDDIGAILDRYAGGPSPRYAYSALLAIKAIVEEVLP
jgi:hypothetical protein